MKNHRQGKRSGVIAIVLTMLAAVVVFAEVAVPAQGLIYNFMNNGSDACAPEGNIVQGRDGNMYGVGVDGGFNGCGATTVPARYTRFHPQEWKAFSPTSRLTILTAALG